MTQMTSILKYADGRKIEHESIQAAMTAAMAEYPDGFAVDAGGFDVDENTTDPAYDVRSGRAAMIWASEDESTNDDGAKSVAEICVEA